MYLAASKGVGTTKGSWEQSSVLIWERRLLRAETSGAMFSTGRGKGKDKVFGK